MMPTFLVRPIRILWHYAASRSPVLRDMWDRLRPSVFPDARYALAKRYLKGAGIEIGALHRPLAVPGSIKVRYVDRLPVPELRAQYPELKNCRLVDTDIVDDGERLGGIADGSQDFVIANHFLEHCEDPIGAMVNFMRVIRPGGIIYMAVPDKRFTFDSDRPVTPLAHLIRDHAEGALWSRSGHFEQWSRLVDDKFKEDPDRDVAQLKSGNYSIHFHVWTCYELLELLVYLRRELLPELETEEFILCGGEAIFILRKGGGSRP
jgi:SAM-dependent methyltransferase